MTGYTSPPNAITITGPSGVPWPKAYSGQPPSAHGGDETLGNPPGSRISSGGSGGKGLVTFGSGGGPVGTIGPGSVDCKGKIEATITWQGSAPRAKCVIVKEWCKVSWGGATGNCNDGLGGTETTTSTGGSSETTRYTVMNNPAAPFKVSNSPTAQASNSAPNNAIGANANVSYKVEIIDPEITLGGGIGPNDAKRYLIGQQVNATLSTPGLTQTSWNWEVLGGEPFKSWIANQNTATYTPLYSETGNNLICYFKVPDEAKIMCSAHLNVPPGELPTAGLDVFVERDCTVRKPDTIYLQAYTPQNASQHPGTTPILLPGYTANGVGLYGGPPPTEMAFRGLDNRNFTYYTNSSGIGWEGYVTTSADTPNPWGSDGGWNYVQTVKGNRQRTYMGTNQENRENSPEEKLDDHYPYAPAPNEPADYGYGYNALTFPANGFPRVAGDGPGDYVNYDITKLEIGEYFGTWMMYQPPGAGSTFVPLKKIKWNWYGKAQKPNTRDWLTTDLVDSNSGWQFEGGDFPDIFPKWSLRSGPLLGEWDPPVVPPASP